MDYKIKFPEQFTLFDCKNEEEAYEGLLDFLQDCVNDGDVTAFEFIPFKEDDK